MKIFLLNVGLMLAGSTLFAQAPFFQSTTYTGAFAPTPTARWTDTWCNFDPQNTSYPTATLQVTSNILVNTTWTNNNVYWINDALIYVKTGATLTIEAGTIIRGSGKGTLIVERGSKIIAQGTAAQPITFTSNSASGARNYGDWGGVVICGSGVHNLVAGANAIVEGGIGDAVTQTGVHGGTNDNDSSGVFSYCRIEFCGISLTAAPNSEINGLSMYSVGRKTKIDHVQVSYSGDDSFEWFGGAVDCRYLVAYRGTDDDFDIDNGFRGRVQFAASFRDPAVADAVSGSNGFESDNDAGGSTLWPKTKAVFSNVTVVGPINTALPGAINSNYRRGVHIRRNSGLNIFNSIIMGYADGFLMDARRTVTNFCQDTSFFRHNILAGMTTDFKLATSPVSDTLCMTSNATVLSFFMGATNDNDTINTSPGVMLQDPYNLANPDARPTGAPSSTGGTFTNPFLLPLAVAANAAFTPSASSVCVGGSLTFTGTAQTATTLQWDIQGGTPSSAFGTAPSSTFNTPGTYVVTLTATNTLGSNSSTVSITVNANPSTPSISQLGSILSTGSFSTYQWYLAGSPIGGATSQNYDADTVAGSYTVMVTNAAGCSATSSIYSYTTGLAAYTLSDNAICEGESITYNATTAGADSYSWIFVGGLPAASNAASVTVTYNTPGNYSTLLTVVDGLNSDNSNGVVAVNGLPSPVIAVSGNDLSTTVSYTSYQWLLAGSPIGGATSSTYTVPSNGAYSVEVTDANGCTNTSTALNFFMGVEDANEVNNLLVYPNPAEGYTTISFDAKSNDIMNIQILDLNGRVVKMINHIEYIAGKNILPIDIQEIATGMYAINIQIGNTFNTQKLIIK